MHACVLVCLVSPQPPSAEHDHHVMVMTRAAWTLADMMMGLKRIKRALVYYQVNSQALFVCNVGS